MLESIISFSSLYWISYSLRICSQISLNVFFSITISGNLQISKYDYLFSTIKVTFLFLQAISIYAIRKNKIIFLDALMIFKL